MKNFHQFLFEASLAVQQAQRMGLEGDGHGGWYKDGEFVAKTEKGRLVFYNKRQKSGQKDPNQTEKDKKISDPNFKDPKAEKQSSEKKSGVESKEPKQQKPISQLEQGPPPVEKTKGTLTIAFGRFNPPTIGHQQLMDTAASAAQQDQGDYLIVPSRSQDPKKNPLDPDTKVSYMRRMFPQHSERIANDANTKTIFDVLKKAHNDGYTNVRIVGGSDRVKEFEKLSSNYNGKLYQFDNIEVLSAGDRDPDAEGIEGMSASRLRLAAAEGDFKTFRSGISPEMSRKEAMELFQLLRQSMGIKDTTNETFNVWEIAPKFDAQTLRENYISENIFRIGQMVENLNTGLIGRIIRRGTNYLICVTEDDIMFKSWIKDVSENFRNKCGVPTQKRLVGTDSYREYVQSMTPVEKIKSFINKNRKK